MKFDVLEPKEMPRYGGHIILTTRAEARLICRAVHRRALLFPDELKRGSAVALALLLRRCGVFGDDLLIGIDPGKRLGLAVSYAGREVEASMFVSEGILTSHVYDMVRGIGPSSYIIRIGDGEMSSAMRIRETLVNAGLRPSCIVTVDETGTSPREQNCNRRGKRDILAARAIAGIGCSRTLQAAAAS